MPQAWIDACVKDLQSAAKGSTLILAGEDQPPVVHALAHAINASLGNVGQTVTYTTPIEDNPENQLASLQQLVTDMHNGNVRMLLILGGNPVYVPADLNFAEELQRNRAAPI